MLSVHGYVYEVLTTSLTLSILLLLILALSLSLSLCASRNCRADGRLYRQSFGVIRSRGYVCTRNRVRRPETIFWTEYNTGCVLHCTCVRSFTPTVCALAAVFHRVHHTTRNIICHVYPWAVLHFV